ATRDVTAWLKCEYMQDHIGDEFKGVISAVTAFGFFVSLEDIFVEGLVHVRTLEGDYFNFDPISHVLLGSRTGISYAMGDKVSVKVAGVNLDERKMDFELLAKLTSAKRSRSVKKEPVSEGKPSKKPRNKKPDLRSEAEKAKAKHKKAKVKSKAKRAKTSKK
ncbi:MAG TPA: S1 RNA-binding domain-containing protein, partial [Agitococcus sp.]|nr:S1 RNA-binding domain-containing protein [Agitococcus sp.]